MSDRGMRTDHSTDRSHIHSVCPPAHHSPPLPLPTASIFAAPSTQHQPTRSSNLTPPPSHCRMLPSCIAAARTPHLSSSLWPSMSSRQQNDHYINIQDESTSPSTTASSSLSAPLLSTSQSADSLHSRQRAASSKAPKAAKRSVSSSLDQSVLATLIQRKEDRSLYKDEAIKSTVTTGRKDAKLTFVRLLSQAGPERPLLIAATVCLFLAALLNLAIPAFCGTIIDAISYKSEAERSSGADWLYSAVVRLGFGDSPRAVLNVSVVILVIVVAVASLFSTLRGYWFTLAGERVVARLRIKLFTHLASLEVGFYDVTRTGELINRLSTDTTVLKDAVTINISMALRWIANIVVGIAYLFFVSWKLTLVMLSVVPLVAIGAIVYGKKVSTHLCHPPIPPYPHTTIPHTAQLTHRALAHCHCLPPLTDQAAVEGDTGGARTRY